MINQILCSTGTFTGRKNGRNHRLVIEYGPQIECDGFEVMIFDDWYDRLDTIIRDYKANSFVCPVVHSDKGISDLISSPDGNKDDGKCGCVGDLTHNSPGKDEIKGIQNDTGNLMSGCPDKHMSKILELWKANCHFAAEIGASKIVLHPYGLPDSDKYMKKIIERIGIMMGVAMGYGLDLLVENVVCHSGSPLANCERLAAVFPTIGIIIDTRQAQFHSELEKTCKSRLWASGNIRHVHINDYFGGHMEWDHLYPIPRPGKGNVDFAAFFGHLREVGYVGTITLEDSVIREIGVDVVTLNEGLRFIKSHFFSASPINQ